MAQDEFRPLRETLQEVLAATPMSKSAYLGASDVQTFRLTRSNPRFLLREGNPRLTLPTTEDRLYHRR